MNRDEWQNVKAIFDAALQLAPAQRREFVAERCGENVALRREVEKLLDSFGDDSFLEKTAVAEVATLIAQAESTNLTAGKRFGHYEIIKQIGAGGMGAVYLAADTRLERKVALKIINNQLSQQESNISRFVREAKAASALNHPNIFVVHEIGRSDGVDYIVSEFIEGKTLRERLKESLPKIAEVLEISVQMASALVAAHAANIVHRDIKPENIVIRPDGLVKILDFGLAKLIERKAVSFEETTIEHNVTARGVILGTFNYMSPEQAKGEPVDERTDIFSLGAVIYEMLTGRAPFADDSLSETLANLITQEPPALSRFAADVPNELQRIVAKMLRKKRDERYQTVKDVFTDLKNLQKRLEFESELERSSEAQTHLSPAETTGKKEIATKDNETGGEKTSKHNSNANRTLPTSILLGFLLLGAIGFVGYYFWSAGKLPSDAGGKKSLAVLPFVNASQDPNAEYLSDGVTESIINNLSQLSGLRVMSRNSAFRFKNDQTDTKNIASQLGMETLVTGDIKQIGERLVINVRLIDASDDSQIWGNQYVKTNSDIIVAQNEIAQAVANNLRLKLTDSERQQLNKNYTKNVEAYQLYLKGRYHASKLILPETQKGIAYFQQAIDLDPKYALAYVGQSRAYIGLALASELSPNETIPKSKTAAQKAIEIDPTLPEAHTALGMLAFWHGWDWATAERYERQALELDPNNAEAHWAYAHLLSNMGRHAEALPVARRGRELDPLDLRIRALEAQFLIHAGRTDEALIRLQEIFELDSNFWMGHLFASKAYIEKGMYREAVVAARRAKELSPVQTTSVAFESYSLAKSGKSDEARSLLDGLLKQSNERFVPPYHIALIYHALGETDETFAWLERGYKERDPKMTFLKVEPKWNDLRSEPRFQELLRRMNFE